jgi:hypothetical protein
MLKEFKRRQELFLDGIEFSIDMGEIGYQRLLAALAAHSARSASGKSVNRLLTAEIFLEAWSLVDIVNRLRVLIQHTPGLKRTPAIVSFLKQTEEVLGLRNFIQHLDTGAPEVAKTGFPIWGSLSWVWGTVEEVERGEFAIMLLIPGRLARSEGHPMVNPVGKKISPPVDMITLTAAGETVNLSRIRDALCQFRGRFDKAVKRALEKPSADQDTAMMIAVEVN